MYLGQKATVDWGRRKEPVQVYGDPTRIIEMEEARSKGRIEDVDNLRAEYAKICSGEVKQWYQNREPVSHLPPTSEGIKEIELLSEKKDHMQFPVSRYSQ